ncbi:MAG: hypothetical protein A2X99_02585 [Deltaproteobacteria bacterium GWB2_55_19]|nr:MAG: hypothetical protein A2X99_02585 [Deltaproteobacteria bacterium GWB2_55_19]HAO94272.1 hypothetical protein [Deltaproteobacteria bacterium]
MEVPLKIELISDVMLVYPDVNALAEDFTLAPDDCVCSKGETTASVVGKASETSTVGAGVSSTPTLPVLLPLSPLHPLMARAQVIESRNNKAFSVRLIQNLLRF